MSGGGGGPNIPFDVIITVDINDPSSWQAPSQTLLDFGFNIWYQQKCTDKVPEACGPTPLCLGKIEGSAIGGAAKLIGIGPYDRPELRGRLYRIEGDFDVSDFLIFSYVHRRVSASENVLVVATGELSGSRTSGRGHYRSEAVVPANEAALRLFGGPKPRHVPQYLLHPVPER